MDDLLDIFDVNDIVDLEHIVDIEIMAPRPRRRKLYKNRQNPFDLRDTDFKTKYRFTKSYVMEIVRIIRPDIILDGRGAAITPELQVLIALRAWARSEIQDDSGDLHGVSQQTVSNICKRVALALARRSYQFIKMPSSLKENDEVVRGFQAVCGFRSVVGAIDCTHIEIKRVPGESSQFYVNRKGWYSLNVQVVCDAKLRIRDIVARWRGSTHDARIFRESRIKERMEAGEFRGLLLGDSGYSCTNYLFTPVMNPSNEKEERYNYSHIRTRNVIERCFGVWKQRFRCLLRGFTTSLENTKVCIVALAVLHNIALNMNEELPGEDMNDDPQLQMPQTQAQPSNTIGRAARNAFINSFF